MNIITLNQVEMSYPQKNKEKRFYALKNLTLEVNKGEIFCLLGPNGSGKTTTINLVNGLTKPTKGEIRVFGMDPAVKIRSVRQKLSVVPQETALYNDLTAQENLHFHAQYYGVDKSKWSVQIETMLNLVGLSERRYDRVGTFSGGMQRRLALARALITSPELILLDEPTLGVDVQSRNSIWDQVRELASEGKTVFLTTNYMEEADSLADRIIIIDRGEIIVSGTPKELKEQVSDNLLDLYFTNASDAQNASERLGKEMALVLENNKLSIKVSNKKKALLVLQAFEADSNGIDSFEWKEPSLNDVFLHFTGKQLRN
ncbi:ABC transporter ATP-binding protein [Paenibacillus sp. NPDC055715]